MEKQRNGAAVVAPTTDAVQYRDAATSSSSWWLGQYNSHRIALLLSERDPTLDEELVIRAGEQVQSTILARTARRRIRSFLKQRDEEWGQQQKQQAGASTKADATSVDLDTALPSPSYGIEEALDVLLSFGLTVKDIAEIFAHTPGAALMQPYAVADTNVTCNGESLQETVDRALVGLLCGTLQLRKYDARKVLRNCPGLLTMRGSKSAEQIVTMLSQLGVSTNSIARDKAALPALLSRSPSAIFRLVAFLSSDAVRMPIFKIGPLLRRSECEELLDAVAPVPRLADTSAERIASIVDEEIMKRGEEESPEPDMSPGTDPLVASALWGRSVQVRRDRINEMYRRMSTTAWTLRHEVGTVDLGKVIAAYPSVLLQDANTKVLPSADYLMNDLGIWQDDLPKVLQLYPALLGMDVADMEKVASFLVSLDVRKQDLASIFRSFPALLTLDVEEDMMPVVEFLRSIGIGNVGRFISRLPPVVGYSVSRELEPKWEYLETVLVDPRFEVSRFPAYFSYPLERVIKTRFEYLRKVKKVPSQLLSLDQVLRFGDKDFAIKVAKDQDKGQAFRAFAQERKKEMAGSGNGRRSRPKQATTSNNMAK